LPADWQRERIVERVRRALPWRVAAALQPFTTALRRRLTRDQERLHGYYSHLHRDAVRSAQTDAGSAHLADRTAAIARDYCATCDDLAGKYALRTAVAWVQTLGDRAGAPAARITAPAQGRACADPGRQCRPPDRRPGRPIGCVWPTTKRWVSAAGLAGCRRCHRLYCRACHSRYCRKCGHAHDVSAAAAAG